MKHDIMDFMERIDMKYFDIDYGKRSFTADELFSACKADVRPAHWLPIIQMLEIQCREDGFQPYVWPDNNGVDILPATKAFLGRTTHPSRYARRYMAQCEEG